MNGGLPRFQSQTLKKLRIPEIDKFSLDVKKRLIKAYDDKDLLTISNEVNKYCTQQRVISNAG